MTMRCGDAPTDISPEILSTHLATDLATRLFVIPVCALMLILRTNRFSMSRRRLKTHLLARGAEVVQLYVGVEHPAADVPIRQLCGFQWIQLAPGEKRAIAFE